MNVVPALGKPRPIAGLERTRDNLNVGGGPLQLMKGFHSGNANDSALLLVVGVAQ